MRNLSLGRPLVEAIEKERKFREVSEGWIFPSCIHDGHRSYMKKQFRRSVLHAGLDPERITPHAMRHTGITRLVQNGVDLATVRRISGHKTLSMVLKYTHVSDAHVDAAIDKIAIGLPSVDAEPVTPLRRRQRDD